MLETPVNPLWLRERVRVNVDNSLHWVVFPLNNENKVDKCAGFPLYMPRGGENLSKQ